MKVDYVEETSVRKALSFEIEPETVEREIEARAKEYAKKAKIPGFRPGKIPAAVIKQRFRQQVLEEVAETIVNRVVFDELEGRGLKPVASPRVTDLKIDENQPMTFRAVFETLPIVELPEYRGLTAKARPAEVTDTQIDAEVDHLREGAARFDPVEDRAVAENDFVVLDVTWKPEGAKASKHDENVLVEVGATDNHKDLNAALVGMTPGESKSVHFSAGEEEGAKEGVKEIAGKAADYNVTLKGIKKKIVPAADDEFAKDLGEFETIADLREAVRKRLVQNEERRIDREVKEALVDALVDRAAFEVPEAMVERHMNARTENAARGLAYQGVDPSKAGVDWRQYRDGQREASLKAAKADILLDEIARREGIEVLEAEVDAELSRLAERVRKPKDALRRQMEKEGDLFALRARIREEKTLDLLKANARLDSE